MYNEKKDHYFKNVRKELLDLIPPENRMGNMLEIGAGGGNTLVYAKKNNYAKYITGIELCKVDNSFQDSDEFDAFLIGDIETMVLPFENNQFDVILLGDVLEHLVDPYAVIRKIKPLLSPKGVIIASLPNIRQVSVLKDIVLNGDFKYRDAGIMDRTHLRFFCKKNIIEMFVDE
jgi:SAM-dependent methyltransferase